MCIYSFCTSVDTVTRFSHVYHPNGLSNTLLSQSCILDDDSHCGNGGQNAHSKDRGGGDKPPVAPVQLTDQLVVMSFRLPPPTYKYAHSNNHKY